MKKIAFTKRIAANGLGTWVSAGIWFGFPKCCISAFEQLAHISKNTDNWPLIGTGFVPCEECATTKTEEQLLQEIAANRFCPVPFPNGDSGRNGGDKQTKWIIKQLTGRIENVLDDNTIGRLRDQVESKRDNHHDNKELREEVQTKLSGLTVRQMLVMKKHRRFFADFWRGTFEVSFPNHFWKNVKVDDDYVSYRVGKTRFVITAASEIFSIADQIEALGGVCVRPANLKRVELTGQPGGWFGAETPPTIEPFLTSLITGEELNKLKLAYDEHFERMGKGSIMQISKTPYVFHSPEEMSLGRGLQLSGLPTGVEEPRLPIIRGEILKEIRQQFEQIREQTKFEQARNHFSKHFVIDSLGGLDAEQLKELKAPVGSVEFTFREEEVNPPRLKLSPDSLDGHFNGDLFNRKLEIINLEQSPGGVKVAVAERAFDPEVVGEVTDDMILPAGIRHMRGLNFKKED